MADKFDFSGYATKNGLKCSDGRTILKDAFKDNDGGTVPLVWQHGHNSPMNVLGHAVLENRADGVYAYCVFNDSETGQQAKALVKHGDIVSLSIFANGLVEKAKNVIHGVIREVSLVLSGANPGALIDNVAIQHADGSEDIVLEEAVIYADQGISLTDIEHSGGKPPVEDNRTVKEIFDTLDDAQKTVVYAMIAHAIEENGDVSHADGDKRILHFGDKGGLPLVKTNIFDTKDDDIKRGGTLTHDQLKVIMDEAKKNGSLKDAILAHATEYGIENIDVLFPDAKTLSADPDWLKREDTWVPIVLNAIHKSPFSRVKSVIADMDFEAARAKGYVKATEKKEVYFKAAKRVTTPQTVYVKQKLDRDDIIDVTDFDIVAMARFQLRTLLDEELAVAALVGDGREENDPYKIHDENIRPIWTDVDLYSVREALTTKVDYAKMIEEIAFSGEHYKGSGGAVFYTTNYHHVRMLWVKDLNERRIYESDATLCAALGVSKIVEVPALVNKVRTDGQGKTHELIGIKVNLTDYNFGADKGGQVATFDDFDIDFNQYKYLMETRCSGALTKPHSAQVYEFQTN